MMLDTSERQILRQITERISTLLRGELPSPLGFEETEDTDVRELLQAVNNLLVSFGQAQDFITALSRGDLDAEVPTRNALVSPFKQLHAVLRHLTWQTEQITKGHLSQRVDFLGDFSIAYNLMLKSMREKKLTEDALRRSERLLSDVFSSIQDGIAVVDTEYTIVRINSSIEDLYPDKVPVLGKKCYEVFEDRTIPCERCDCNEGLRSTRLDQVISPTVAKDGAPSRWIERISFPMFDKESNEITGRIAYVRDVTERQKAEEQLRSSLEEKEVLMREIHHRVKNNFQAVCGLISLQASYMPEEAYMAILQDTEARILAMAHVHERLYESESLAHVRIDQYVQGIVDDLLSFYKGSDANVQFRYELEEISLNVDTAIPCGLMVTELVTNAIKHAFPQGREGVITIRLKSINGEKLELTVSDDGVGFPEHVEVGNTQTLGLDLISAFAKKLRGEIKLNRDHGTVFSVRFRELNTSQNTEILS
jgi:PAS domain S-box-containing protein